MANLFLAWVKQGLVPVLQRDDVVILDNLSTHKVAGVLEAIEAAGARLDDQSNSGATALVIACMHGEVATARTLIAGTAGGRCRHGTWRGPRRHHGPPLCSAGGP